MGWNDSQRDASTAFLFVFSVLSLYRVHQTQKKILGSEKEVRFGLNCNGKWSCYTAEELQQKKRGCILVWTKSWNLKFAELFYSLGKSGKCESFIFSLGELRAYCASSSFFSSTSSPCSILYFCAISWVRVGVSHVISLHCCSCWDSYLTQLSFIKKNLPIEWPAAHRQVTYSTSETAVQFDACWIRKCDHSN